MKGRVDPTISLMRLIGRYFLAFWLIPIGLLCGVCAILHWFFRKLPGVRSRVETA